MTDADRLKRYDDLLSDYFPPDFKDWHQNSRDEWPELVVMALRGRDEEIARLEKFVEADERQIKRQAETIQSMSQENELHNRDKRFVLFHLQEFLQGRIDIRELPVVEEIQAMLGGYEQKTDKPAIGGEVNK